MTEQILDHRSLSGHAPKGCGVCCPGRQAVHWGAFTWEAGWQEERWSPRDGQPKSAMLKVAV